jgi:probable phosphoglycerate mutase
MTELLLIRHGETDWNRRKCFQGHIDIPLNERGLTQAARLAAKLAGERIDALVVSDLTRTRQTAAPLAELHRLSPSYTPALREQAFGILEGLTFDDIRVKHPAEFALWAKHEPDYALPGGAESRTLFHRRVIATLSELAARHRGQRLAVVTHGGVLDMVWRSAKGLPLHGARECLIPNTGVNRVQFNDGRFDILSWAEDEHIRDLID